MLELSENRDDDFEFGQDNQRGGNGRLSTRWHDPYESHRQCQEVELEGRVQRPRRFLVGSLSFPLSFTVRNFPFPGEAGFVCVFLFFFLLKGSTACLRPEPHFRNHDPKTREGKEQVQHLPKLLVGFFFSVLFLFLCLRPGAPCFISRSFAAIYLSLRTPRTLLHFFGV